MKIRIFTTTPISSQNHPNISHTKNHIGRSVGNQTIVSLGKSVDYMQVTENSFSCLYADIARFGGLYILSVVKCSDRHTNHLSSV